MSFFKKITKGIGKTLKKIGKQAKAVLPGLVSVAAPQIASALNPVANANLNPVGTVQSSNFNLGDVLQGALDGALGGAIDVLRPAPPKTVTPEVLAPPSPSTSMPSASSMLPLVAAGVAAYLFFFRR